GVGEGNDVVRADHDDWMADRVEHDLRKIERTHFGLCGTAHAASFMVSGAALLSASRTAAITAAGSKEVIAMLRSLRGAAGAWRSRYQPRCLRAWRRPLSVP